MSVAVVLLLLILIIATLGFLIFTARKLPIVEYELFTNDQSYFKRIKNFNEDSEVIWSDPDTDRAVFVVQTYPIRDRVPDWWKKAQSTYQELSDGTRKASDLDTLTIAKLTGVESAPNIEEFSMKILRDNAFRADSNGIFYSGSTPENPKFLDNSAFTKAVLQSRHEWPVSKIPFVNEGSLLMQTVSGSAGGSKIFNYNINKETVISLFRDDTCHKLFNPAGDLDPTFPDPGFVVYKVNPSVTCVGSFVVVGFESGIPVLSEKDDLYFVAVHTVAYTDEAKNDLYCEFIALHVFNSQTKEMSAAFRMKKIKLEADEGMGYCFGYDDTFDAAKPNDCLYLNRFPTRTSFPILYDSTNKIAEWRALQGDGSDQVTTADGSFNIRWTGTGRFSDLMEFNGAGRIDYDFDGKTYTSEINVNDNGSLALLVSDGSKFKAASSADNVEIDSARFYVAKTTNGTTFDGNMLKTSNYEFGEYTFGGDGYFK